MLILASVLAGICWWNYRDNDIEKSRVANRITAQKYCTQYNLPTDLVFAIITAESNWNPNATSKVNARGLMQIMSGAQTDVARKYGVKKGDPFDPDYNLHVGIAYLRILTDRKRFGGSAYLVVGAYNMGPTALTKLRIKYPNLSPKQLIEKHATRETRVYCRKILNGKDRKLPPTK